MDFAVARLTVGVPNDLQMERNLTGGLPVVYQGHLTRLGPFRERLTPAHERNTRGEPRRGWERRIAKRTRGKMFGCKRRTRMQMHDMNKMQKRKTKPDHEGNIISHSRKWQVGVTNMASCMRGVTTLHHYERISSRDLGLKELRIFGTEMVLAFPGGLPVGMVRPLHFQEFD